MAYTYKKATDTEHKIKLESKLLYAVWRTGMAPAGGEVSFEVMTSFVGNGAPVKVKGKSEGGANLGKVDGTMRNNKFVGTLAVPEDIEIDDAVYFEVKLPKNGLSGESNRIPAVPAIVVSNLKWSAPEARRRDVLTLSADVAGARNGTEATFIVYEDHGNRIFERVTELSTEVENGRVELLWEFEYHEPTLEIATEKELQKHDEEQHYVYPKYFFVVEICGQRFGGEQESGLLIFKDRLDFRLLDEAGRPFANEKYILVLADGNTREGTLDDDGYGFETDLPPGCVRIMLPDSGYVFGKSVSE